MKKAAPSSNVALAGKSLFEHTVIPRHFAVHLSRIRYFADFHNAFFVHKTCSELCYHFVVSCSYVYVHKTAWQIYIKLAKLSCNFEHLLNP